VNKDALEAAERYRGELDRARAAGRAAGQAYDTARDIATLWVRLRGGFIVARLMPSELQFHLDRLVDQFRRVDS
jgi:hypothetical protein